MKYFLTIMILAGAAFAQSPAKADAIDALRALKSVTDVGTNFRDYTPRVLDAKIKVDRYLATPDQNDAPVRAAVAATMQYYAMASKVWYAQIFFRQEPGLQRETAEAVMADSEISACPVIAVLIDKAKVTAANQKSPGPGDPAYKSKWWKPSPASAFLGYDLEPSAFWKCADAKLAQATAAH